MDSSFLSKQPSTSPQPKLSFNHIKACTNPSPSGSGDKASSSTFSEDQYNDTINVPDFNRDKSTTPKIRAMSSLKLAMSNMMDNKGSKSDGFPSGDVVRAAIHHLGDLFCEFNESKLCDSTYREHKNSANLSYKEHANESIDANGFIQLLEDKFSLYGYNVAEMNGLFLRLKPQTPLQTGMNANIANNKVLTIHFTEFNVVIHQFYASQFKSIFVEKTSYQKHDIHQLLLHSIKSKLEQIRKSLNDQKDMVNTRTRREHIPSPINMQHLLVKHKIEQEQLRQRMLGNENDVLARSPVFDMEMSPTDDRETKSIGALGVHGITNVMMMDIVDTPISNEADSDEYDLDDDDDDDDEYHLQEIHEEIQIETHIQFGESRVIIECGDINPKYGYYAFHAPHTLSQDEEEHHLYRLESARSNDDDTDVSSMFTSTGNASPLSFLSNSLALHCAKDNPFKVANPGNDAVYQRQEYMYQFCQFFVGNVYLTRQQLRFVDINPVLPNFMKEEEASASPNFMKEEESKSKSDILAPRNRSGNIRDIAQINTEVNHPPLQEGDEKGKVNENKDLYDEDKKLAALLQSLCSINYDFVPNGLLTHRQFIEFIDSLQIYNYDENVLKHMFRYIYTEELPPILPPPVVIEFNDEEEDNYNNVNGMYVAYSECIGYEYDEILDLVNDNKANKQCFDDLLTTMVVEKLQQIYQTLKFDDLDAHPNQFLHRQQSFYKEQEHDKLDGDELKENVFNFFDQQNTNILKNAAHHMHRQSFTQNTGISTMRSTGSDTLTYHGIFRQSIISHDSLKNMIENLKKDKLAPNKGSPKPPRLVNATSSSTVTLTLHHPQTPISPNTNTSNMDIFDKYPALIDITDIPPQYHHKIHSLQSKLLKKPSLNALLDDDTYKSSTTTLHTNQVQNNASPSMTNITGITNVAVDNFTPKEASDDDHNIIQEKLPPQPPVFVTSSSNDSSNDVQIVSPNTGKRKRNRGHSASRQPSLPTLPEEHIDHANHNNKNNLQPNGNRHSGDSRTQSQHNNIDDKVDQLFATIGSDQVHIDLLKYGLRLIEISLHDDEHRFLQMLQTYPKHKYKSRSQQRFFVHKDWIKQFVHDDNLPHSLQSLQHKMKRNLRRKAHLLASELSRRSSSYGAPSTYATSDDSFTKRATKNSEHMLLPREVQQTYVAYFKETLKSRSKALIEYTQTRYPPSHKKYWRDIFLYMSKNEKYLDRITFKDGIERCGIKIRRKKKRGKKRRNKHEIEQILNAVFVEMDFENTGYITVHAFTNMMMAQNASILSSFNSSTAYHDHSHYSNKNSAASANLYDVYSNYGISESTTNPRKSYENMAMQRMPYHHHQQYNHNYNHNHNQYLSPYHAQHLSPYHAYPVANKQENKNENIYSDPYGPYNGNGSANGVYADDDVEEKIHSNGNGVAENDEKYLNNTWNSMNEYKAYACAQDEDEDEKIAMLDVLNDHERQMQVNVKKKKKKGKSKKKNKKSINKTLSASFSFIVSRKKVSSLDLVLRRYYLTIDADRECVILSPLNDCMTEVSMQFGLHQIIVGEHQSTMIQVKTVNGKHIYYEFDVRQSKDEFVDLLDSVKQESSGSNLAPDIILPRGVGFNNDLRNCVSLDDDDIDVDPIYDDECSVCRAMLCTSSTMYWMLLVSLVNAFIIYLNTKYALMLVWILINMICLRLCAISVIRTNVVIIFSKIFDCIWCHRFMYYGFSAHSLVTVWSIFWLFWNTMRDGVIIWHSHNNTTLEIICFGFCVLSFTFLLFAQFAYCRCRCCSVTVSQLLHNVLARLASFFIAIYGVLYCFNEFEFEFAMVTSCASFWFCIVLMIDFVFYVIYICVLQKHQLRIEAMHISVRVISEEQCELQIPFKISPFQYIWISDDGASWIKLPILLTTNKYKKANTKIKKKHNIEENPYQDDDYHHHHHHHHHKGDNSAEHFAIELRDIYKLKRKQAGYEAVGQGQVVEFKRAHGRAGFIGSSVDEDDLLEYINHDSKCTLVIHSRNKIGQRMIEKSSHCFEDADFCLYIKKYDTPLTIMCFAFIYKRIAIIATDDRVIPAIAYIFNQEEDNTQHQDVLWIVNKPKKQYYNLYQLLQLSKNNNNKRNIKIVDMTKKKNKKKSSKQKQIASFMNNISAQAIFALTSRYQGQRIKKESKHAVVYIQYTEWY